MVCTIEALGESLEPRSLVILAERPEEQACVEGDIFVVAVALATKVKYSISTQSRSAQGAKVSPLASIGDCRTLGIFCDIEISLQTIFEFY